MLRALELHQHATADGFVEWLVLKQRSANRYSLNQIGGTSDIGSANSEATCHGSYPSLFAVEIVKGTGTDDFSFGRTYQIFVAIRIVARLANRIISDYVKDQVLSSVISHLMGLTRLEDESVTSLDIHRAILVADFSGTGNDVVELPLRTVRMKGTNSLAGRNAANLDIKRVAFF